MVVILALVAFGKEGFFGRLKRGGGLDIVQDFVGEAGCVPFGAEYA